ncbi:MAG: hypothetical protein ACI4MR_00260 [Candidatus Aphodomorpha sp.]
MRSIIEEIAHAETEAEAIRQSAAAESRELIQKARADAEQETARLAEQEREKTRTALEKAEEDGKQLAQTIQQDLLAAADAQCSNAQQRVDEAIHYLMQKVQEIA